MNFHPFRRTSAYAHGKYAKVPKHLLSNSHSAVSHFKFLGSFTTFLPNTLPPTANFWLFNPAHINGLKRIKETVIHAFLRVLNAPGGDAKQLEKPLGCNKPMKVDWKRNHKTRVISQHYALASIFDKNTKD